jgi:hypothetical protein
MKTINRICANLISRQFNEDGQSTAEYSLVIVGAAAIAGVLIAWATSSGAIGNLFNSIIDNVMGHI